MSHGFSRIITDKPAQLSVDFLAMDAASPGLKHSELTDKIIGVFYDVYNELGYGFLESTYAEALVIALQDVGRGVAREVPVSVWFRGRKAGQYFADLLVESTILLELKTARAIESAHEAQFLHYLRATQIEIGLLLNFGLRPQFRRLVFNNERKKIRENPCGSAAKVSA